MPTPHRAIWLDAASLYPVLTLRVVLRDGLCYLRGSAAAACQRRVQLCALRAKGSQPSSAAFFLRSLALMQLRRSQVGQHLTGVVNNIAEDSVGYHPPHHPPHHPLRDVLH